MVIFCKDKEFRDFGLNFLNKYRQCIDTNLPLLTVEDAAIAYERLKGGTLELMPHIKGSRSYREEEKKRIAQNVFTPLKKKKGGKRTKTKVTK